MTQGSEAADAKHVILVVDDDCAVIDSLKFLLEVEGFEVRVYSSGNELLNEVSVPPLSCLIVDFQMAETDGLELVAKLRDRNISIPAILITVHPNADLRNRAGAAGVPIVEKPFLGPRLLLCVREAFDGYSRSLS